MEPEAPPRPCQPLWEVSQKLSTCLSPGITARARGSRGHSQRVPPALLSAPSLPLSFFHVLTTGSHPNTCRLPDRGKLSIGLLEPWRPSSGGRPPKILSVMLLFLVKWSDVKSFSPVWLFAIPWTTVRGILQARILDPYSPIHGPLQSVLCSVSQLLSLSWVGILILHAELLENWVNSDKRPNITYHLDHSLLSGENAKVGGVALWPQPAPLWEPLPSPPRAKSSQTWMALHMAIEFPKKILLISIS